MLVNWALRPGLRESCEEFDRSLCLQGIIVAFEQPHFLLLFKLSSVLSVWDKNKKETLSLAPPFILKVFPSKLFAVLNKMTVQEQGYKTTFFKNKVVLQQQTLRSSVQLHIIIW